MQQSLQFWQIFVILGMGILAISTSAIWVRLALDIVGNQGLGFSLFLAASRLAIASVLLIPTWHKFKGVNASLWAYLWAILAGITLSLHFSFWITSLSFTSIAASTVIVTTNPIWVSLLGWLIWREKLSWQTMGGMVIALGGGILIALGDLTGNQGSNPLFGDFLALIGAITVSGYLLLGREAQRQGLSIRQYIIIAYGVATLILLPLPPLWGIHYGGYSLPIYLYIFLMAIFPQLLGHTVFNWAMTQMSATLVSLVILCEPVGASLLGVLIFQEIPSLQVVMGGIILLFGVGIAIFGNKFEGSDSSLSNS